MHPFSHYPMPTNGHAETPVSINCVYSLLIITVSCNPKMSRFHGQQFIIKVNCSMEIRIGLLVIISGKSEPGRTSAPSANGITSHRFLFLSVSYKFLEFFLNTQMSRVHPESNHLITFYLQ
jgi:plant G-box-binding factor